MSIVAELLIALLIVLGGLFALVGSFGLVKLPDLMTRLHAPTKATTLGVGGCLLGSMGYFLLVDGRVSIHELGITLFLFLTAPVTANMIAKAHLHRHRETTDQLPTSATGSGWATIDQARPAQPARPGSD